MKALSTAANHSQLGSPSRACWPLRRGATPQGGGPRRARRSRPRARWPTPCSSRCCRDGARPRRGAPGLPDDREPADVVVVPVRALGVGGGVRDRRGMESPRAGLAVVPLAAAVAYSRVHVGVHWTSDVVVGAAVGSGVGAGDRALVAGARAGRGAGPADGHGARAARRQGPGDRVQPALRRPGIRPGRRAGGRAAAGGRGARRSGPRPRRAARRGHRARRVGARRRRGGRGRHGGRGGRGGRAAWAAAGGGADGHAQPLRPRRRRVRPAGGGGRDRPGRRWPWTSRWSSVHPGRGADPEVGRGDPGARLPQHREPRLVPRPRAAARAVAAAVGQVARVRRGARHRAAAGRAGAVKIEGRWARCGSSSSATAPTTRAGWSRRGGRRWTPGCWTCAGCAPTCGSPGCAPCWALLAGALGHSRVYGERQVPELDVELAVPGCSPPTVRWSRRRAATRSGWPTAPIPVYRRDERRWTGRDRPYQRV